MEIVGKDFNVDNRDLVRIAMRDLSESGTKITLQSVSDLSGLTIPQVQATLQQMAAEYEKK